MTKPSLHPSLRSYCASLEAEFPLIPESRKAQLLTLSAYIARKRQAGEPVRLTVICTHNSRRSHIGQLWLQAAAAWYGVEEVNTFSGGTEATAFHPNAVAAMVRAGFKIKLGGNLKSTPNLPATNPPYEASLGSRLPKMHLFSKQFGQPPNPLTGFAAIMVCSEADAGCPFVPGAEARFSLPYDDPKASDGSSSMAQTYDERCRQIGREMFFVMKGAMGGQVF